MAHRKSVNSTAAIRVGRGSLHLVVLDAAGYAEKAPVRVHPHHSNPAIQRRCAREIVRVVCRNAEHAEPDLARNERPIDKTVEPVAAQILSGRLDYGALAEKHDRPLDPPSGPPPAVALMRIVKSCRVHGCLS